MELTGKTPSKGQTRLGTTRRGASAWVVSPRASPCSGSPRRRRAGGRERGRRQGDTGAGWRWPSCWIRQGRWEEAEGLLAPILAALRTESNPVGERHVLDHLAQCDLGRGGREAALAKIEAAAALGHPVFEAVDLLSEVRTGRPFGPWRVLRSSASTTSTGWSTTSRWRAEFLAIAARWKVWRPSRAWPSKVDRLNGDLGYILRASRYARTFLGTGSSAIRSNA